MSLAKHSGVVLNIMVSSVTWFAAGCVDDAAVEGPRPEPRWSASSLPIDSIAEHSELLAIAKEVAEFAGAYFDDQGNLVVAMTSESRRGHVERLIRGRLASHQTSEGNVDRGNVRFVSRTAQFPFIQLARYRTVLRRYVFAIPGVVALDLKESVNRIQVRIAVDGAEEAVRRVLSDLEIPSEAVIFERGPYPVASSHTLDDVQPDLVIQGAWKITNANDGACSLGFPALTLTHSPVFVTNSHCTIIEHGYDGSFMGQPTAIIGYEMLDPDAYEFCDYDPSNPPIECRESDSALFAASGRPIQFGRIARTTDMGPVGCEWCTMSVTIDHANPTLQITGKRGFVIENEILNKIGQSSGWTRGAVENTCEDVAIWDSWMRLCSDRVDYASQPGDSGAPVFSLLSNGTVQLVGIHFGHCPSICLGYSDAWISNLNQIEKDLGSLIVFDPGPPVVTISGPNEVPPNVPCFWNAEIANYGYPPYTYQWSGLFTGSGSGVGGTVSNSGSLSVVVTDGVGRQGFASTYITVQSGLPPLCE